MPCAIPWPCLTILMRRLSLQALAHIDGLKSVTTMPAVGWARKANFIPASINAVKKQFMILFDRRKGSRKRKIHFDSCIMLVSAILQLPFLEAKFQTGLGSVIHQSHYRHWFGANATARISDRKFHTHTPREYKIHMLGTFNSDISQHHPKCWEQSSMLFWSGTRVFVSRSNVFWSLTFLLAMIWYDNIHDYIMIIFISIF